MSTTYSKIVQENICVDRSMELIGQRADDEQMGQNINNDQSEKRGYTVSTILATFL